MFSMNLSSENWKQYDWVKQLDYFLSADNFKQYCLSKFYDENVEIRQEHWEKSCNIVDQVLSTIEEKLKSVIKKRFPDIGVGEFVPQGSASEGLKITHANEFDVAIPLYCDNLRVSNTVCCDASCSSTDHENQIGFTKLYVENKEVRRKLRRVRYYIKTTEAKELFRFVLCECIDNIKQETKDTSNEHRNNDVSVKVDLELSNSPAVELQIHILNSELMTKLGNINKLYVDLVPLFPMREIKRPNMANSASTNVVMKSPSQPCRSGKSTMYLEQDVFWKICFDHIESNLLQTLLDEHHHRYVTLILSCSKYFKVNKILVKDARLINAGMILARGFASFRQNIEDRPILLNDKAHV